MGVNVKVLAAQITVMLVVFACALFGSAGTIAWPAGWTFLVLFFGFTAAITLWLYRYNPGLLRERMTGFTPDQKSWDKVFIVLTNLAFTTWLVVMPLDAVRFHWSRMPVALQAVGAVLLLCSFYVFFLAFRENSYLSPLVRIQKERGQTVISTGPYRCVRHPMYSGFVLFSLGPALLLGSWCGVLLGLVLIAMVARRAVLEEQMLREGLAGYAEYMSRVRYRLIPRLW